MATDPTSPRNHVLRRLAAAGLLLTTLALTGCGGVTPAPADGSAAAAEDVEVLTSDNVYVTKPIVEGTELLCLTKGHQASTTCNWELWNKTREAGQ